MLIDCVANLTDNVFQSDADQVVERALLAHVDKIIISASNDMQSLSAVELALRHNQSLYASIGIHPHYAAACYGRWSNTLERLGKMKRVVSVGECGLDFVEFYAEPEIQEQCFEAQLEYASQHQLPIILRQVNAHDAFLELVEKYRPSLVAGMINNFCGTAEELKDYLDLDLYIGISGSISDGRTGKRLAKLVPHIPGDRILLCSDAPRQLPSTVRPKPRARRNEPMFLGHVCQSLAKILSIPAADLAHITSQNAMHFFKLD